MSRFHITENREIEYCENSACEYPESIHYTTETAANTALKSTIKKIERNRARTLNGRQYVIAVTIKMFNDSMMGEVGRRGELEIAREALKLPEITSSGIMVLYLSARKGGHEEIIEFLENSKYRIPTMTLKDEDLEFAVENMMDSPYITEKDLNLIYDYRYMEVPNAKELSDKLYINALLNEDNEINRTIYKGHIRRTADSVAIHKTYFDLGFYDDDFIRETFGAWSRFSKSGLNIDQQDELLSIIPGDTAFHIFELSLTINDGVIPAGNTKLTSSQIDRIGRHIARGKRLEYFKRVWSHPNLTEETREQMKEAQFYEYEQHVNFENTGVPGTVLRDKLKMKETAHKRVQSEYTYYEVEYTVDVKSLAEHGLSKMQIVKLLGLGGERDVKVVKERFRFE